jgi:hypothetical protein
MQGKLHARISRAFAKSAFDTREYQFLPDGEIDKLITKAAIIRELGKKSKSKRELSPDDSERQELADYIVDQKAKRVFATAVMAGLTGDDLRKGMQAFKDAGISDSTLPISLDFCVQEGILTPSTVSTEGSVIESVGDSSDKSEKDEDVNDEDEEDENQEVWTTPRLDTFCLKQWLFLSPVFRTSNFEHNLDQFCILPFTVKHRECDSGTFGQVTKYEIHKAHLVDPKDPVSRPPGHTTLCPLRADYRLYRNSAAPNLSLSRNL